MCGTFPVVAQQLNLVKGQPISGFPDIKGNPFEQLVDGDDATFWYLPDAVDTKWTKLSLSGEHWIDRILLKNHKGIEHIRILVNSADSVIEVFSGKLPENHLITFTPTWGTSVTLEFFKAPKVHSGKPSIFIGEIEVYAYEPQPVFVNQVGYNLFGIKRFTAPLAVDGSEFVVRDSLKREMYRGTVKGGKGDFSPFNPSDPGPYHVEVCGLDTGRSFIFNIEPYLIERVSYPAAIAFMSDTRCWYGCADGYEPTDEGPGCPFLGVAWRDSHQFSFEIPVLISMYFANPDAFSKERMPEEGVYSGLREELPLGTPEIVKMIYWAVDIYLRGNVNHTLLKSQLAWFIYAWPHLSEYIPRRVYDEAVDYLFPIWGSSEKDRWHWHDIDHSADLFQTFTVIGSGKGQFPPGFSIIPNLMMYEVAKREGRTDADSFFKAAYDQTVWLLVNLDWDDPATTKGQRMNEYVTLDAFFYFLRQYPDNAPAGLREKICDWAAVAIIRSNNLWDYRMYSENKWTIPDLLYPDDPKFNADGSYNEVGNIAGFPAPALAAARTIGQGGSHPAITDRLREIATAQTDHVFGRNPTGRHFSYDAVEDFPGADLGWFREWDGGAGMLQTVRGVLDGSVKESSYPYNPYGGDPGHAEGWVTFNTAWMMGLAYQAADATRIDLLHEQKDEILRAVNLEERIRIRLHAPLNFDPSAKELASVVVTHGSTGEVFTVDLGESSNNGAYFEGVLEPSMLPFRAVSGDMLTVSYGMEHMKESVDLAIK